MTRFSISRGNCQFFLSRDGEFLYLVTKSLKSRRLNLLSNYEICLQNFSFSSRNRRNNFWISPSLLHTREIIADFSFFLQKFLFSSRTRKQISFLFLELEMWIPYFSLSSRFDFLASRQCLVPCAMTFKTSMTFMTFMTHRNFIFDIFELCELQKYNTCWIL